jgi:hypothetical protein
MALWGATLAIQFSASLMPGGCDLIVGDNYRIVAGMIVSFASEICWTIWIIEGSRRPLLWVKYVRQCLCLTRIYNWFIIYVRRRIGWAIPPLYHVGGLNIVVSFCDSGVSWPYCFPAWLARWSCTSLTKTPYIVSLLVGAADFRRHV